MQPSIVFINYINRSGSTLLCRLLDAYDGISVGIEAGFPGFVHEIIPDKYKTITTKQSLDRYLDILFKDIRFQQWKVDREKLTNSLITNGYPITFKDILLSCLKEYFGNEESTIWVHKVGYYIDMLDQARFIFPSAKYIYIVRDPRAIFSSQKNAVSIYSGRPMSSSLPIFTFQYKHRMNIAANNLSRNDFLLIKYEELVQVTNFIEKKVLPFLGVPYAIKSNRDNYAEKIPDNQSALHEHVSSPPNRQSIDKWKKGLQLREILFIQKKLKNEMKNLNYKFLAIPNISWRDHIFCLIDEFQYQFFSLKYFLHAIRVKLFRKNEMK